MAKFKNTAAGGRGFPAVGCVASGQTVEIDDSKLAEARKDPIVDGWFGDGTFLIVKEPRAAAAVMSAQLSESVEPDPKAKNGGGGQGGGSKGDLKK